MGVFKPVEHAPFSGRLCRARFTVEFISLNHSAHITFRIIMLFRTHTCHIFCIWPSPPWCLLCRSQQNFCPHCWPKNVARELLHPFACSCGPVFSKGSREWTFFNFTFHFSLIRQVFEQINGLIKNFTEQFYLLWSDGLRGHWYITPQEITAPRPHLMSSQKLLFGDVVVAVTNVCPRLF